MRSEIIYLAIVFISILIVTILINRTIREPFIILPNNSVIGAIEIVKKSFTALKTKAEEMKKTEIQTPKETKLTSYVIEQNLKNLDALSATYESMDNYDLDPVSSVNSIQANLNEYIEIYNYINGKLELGLDALKTNMITVPTAQSSWVEFNKKLALSPTALNKQLKQNVVNKVPTTISSRLPVQSALQSPPKLIKVYKAPPQKSEVFEEDMPIFDIYDQLIKVYGPIY